MPASKNPVVQLEDGTQLTMSTQPAIPEGGGGPPRGGPYGGGSRGRGGGYAPRGGGGGPFAMTVANTELMSKQQRGAEGDNATHVIIRCEDVDTMQYSCDLGLWPLEPILATDLQNLYARGTAEVPRPVILVVLCEGKQKYVGYMYMTGRVMQRSEVVMEKQLPNGWNTLCRVGWVRIGPLSLDSIRQHTSLLEEDKRVLLSAADGSMLPLALGRTLCTLIDDSAAIKVLPNRERQRHFPPGSRRKTSLDRIAYLWISRRVTCVTRLIYLSIGEGSVVSERIAPAWHGNPRPIKYRYLWI